MKYPKLQRELVAYNSRSYWCTKVAVFVRATEFEETKKRDVLKLSQAINEKLNEVSSRSGAKSSIVFIDADDYPDVRSISGG